MKKKKITPFKISWVAHAHEYKERSGEWFWSMWIIVFALAITSVIFGNIILGILILVSAFSLSLFVNQEPDEIEVVVNEQGIRKGDVFYPYEALAGFHIDIDHSHKKVMLRSQRSFIPLIIVPLGDADAEKVHGILSQFLTEEQHSLTFVEKILEFLGF